VEFGVNVLRNIMGDAANQSVANNEAAEGVLSRVRGTQQSAAFCSAMKRLEITAL
jgi:hypothetical protein